MHHFLIQSLLSPASIKEASHKVYTKKINSCFTLLDNICKVPHSDGAANEGEAYPMHLRDVIAKYLEIKESADDGNKTGPTLAQTQHSVQMNVQGIMPATGPVTEVLRYASLKANDENGLSRVQRGSVYNEIDPIVRQSLVAQTGPPTDVGDFFVSPSKRVRPNSGKAKPDETMQQLGESRVQMANAVQMMASAMKAKMEPKVEDDMGIKREEHDIKKNFLKGHEKRLDVEIDFKRQSVMAEIKRNRVTTDLEYQRAQYDMDNIKIGQLKEEKLEARQDMKEFKADGETDLYEEAKASFKDISKRIIEYQTLAFERAAASQKEAARRRNEDED